MTKQNPEVVREAMTQMPDNKGLATLAELGRDLSIELATQDELAKALQESKAKSQRLEEVAIPELMQQLGIDELKLKSGDKISLQPVYSASVPDERKPAAWAWLREHDFGSLIKTTFKMSFGMGEEKEVDKAKVALDKKGIPYICIEDVHASTLKSFVKERYEKGEQFPEAIFGAFTKTVARLKTNK
jgi:hypothetical protein